MTTTLPNGSAVAAVVKLTETRAYKLPTAVLAVDVHPDNSTAYAACFDAVYELKLDAGTHRLIGKHESYVSGVRYLKASGHIVTAGFDGALQWIDPNAAQSIRKAAAHAFWSWKMRVSQDGRLVGSVTGQYLAGGYKYEPAPETEPCVRVYDAATGQLKWSFSHVPPVLSTAFSPDSRYIAAGNLMGEVRIWDLETGKQAANWTTPDFTCWGIIKNHHYVGGIFDMCFTPDGKELMVCGMGPMVDPMAGNGKQTWQRFAWRETPARKAAQIADGDAGAGLMEVIRFHPDGGLFLMAGRLNQGKWNTALFDSGSGKLVHAIDSKMRVTDAAWIDGGKRLALCGASQQERPKDGKCPEFGHVKIYTVES